MTEDNTPFVDVPNRHQFGQRPPSLKYWDVGLDITTRAKERYSVGLKDDKALVFYFGGIPTMNHLREPEVAIRNEVQEYIKGFSADDVSLTIVAEASYSATAKFDLHEKYNADPEHYTSPSAEEFVKDIMLPLVKDAKNAEDIKQQFSRLTFIGHSYGSGFIQCIDNALTDALHERTQLTEEEIKDVKSVISGLNIGPTTTVVEKEDGIHQFSTVATSDETSFEKVDYTALAADDHPVLSHRQMGNHVLMVSNNMGKHTLALLARGEGVQDASTEHDGGHSMRLYMNVDQDVRDDLRTYQVSAGAAIARDFLQSSVQGSIDAAKSGGVRDMEAISTRILEESLTPEAKDAIGEQLQQSKRSMAQFIQSQGFEPSGP